MRITLLAVGRMRSKPLREVCEDFLSRLQHFGAVEVQELKASDAATPQQSVQQECSRILDALNSSDTVLILDERGTQRSSPELAEFIKEQELRAVKRLVLVLGGAYGLSDDVRKRGKLFSLSKMTLPHELCRAVILEQLYRARSIQHGLPYHHA